MLSCLLAVDAGSQEAVAVHFIGSEGGCNSTVDFRAHCEGSGARLDDSASVGRPVAA